MNRTLFTLLSILSFTLLACSSDDGPSITPEQRQLIMGDDGDGILTLGLESPITIARDDVHSNLRELDLDQNDLIDIAILAYEEFAGDKGLIVSTPNTDNDAELIVNENGMVIPLTSGEIVKFDEGTWAAVNEAALAVFNASDNSTAGLWNGLDNRFIALRMQNNNTRYLAWVELSVSDHDNYSFHNYGIKIVP